MIELKNITTISDNTDTLDDGYIAHWIIIIIVGCSCYIVLAQS